MGICLCWYVGICVWCLGVGYRVYLCVSLRVDVNEYKVCVCVGMLVFWYACVRLNGRVFV